MWDSPLREGWLNDTVRLIPLTAAPIPPSTPLLHPASSYTDLTATPAGHFEVLLQHMHRQTEPRYLELYALNDESTPNLNNSFMFVTYDTNTSINHPVEHTDNLVFSKSSQRLPFVFLLPLNPAQTNRPELQEEK